MSVLLLFCSSPHESAVCIRLGEHGPAAAKKKPGQLFDEQLDEIHEAFPLFDSDAFFAMIPMLFALISMAPPLESQG